MKGLCLFLN